MERLPEERTPAFEQTRVEMRKFINELESNRIVAFGESGLGVLPQDQDMEELFVDAFINQKEEFNVVIPASISLAKLMTNFLENNDTTIYRIDGMNPDYFDRLETLKVMYDTSSVKFKILGFEVCQNSVNYYSAQLLFRDLFIKNESRIVNSNVSNDFKTFVQLVGTNNLLSETERMSSSKLYDFVSKILNEDQTIYKEIFQDNYNCFYQVLENIKLGYPHRHGCHPQKDSIIYKRFKKILKKKPQTKFFICTNNVWIAEWQTSFSEEPTFIEMLSNDGYDVQSILNINSYVIHYTNHREDWNDYLISNEVYFNITSDDTRIMELLREHYFKRSNIFINTSLETDFKKLGTDYVLLFNQSL